MRKQIFTGVTMLGLLLTLAVASIHAQSGTTIEITVPFDFTVGKTHLQAGKYSARCVSHVALLFRSDNGKQGILIFAPRAISGDKDKPERMVFNYYAGRYFLAQVWMLRGDTGRGLNPSKAERALAKKLQVAKNDAKPRRVEVVAGAR